MEQLDLSYFIKTKSQSIDFSNHIAHLMEQIYHKGFDLEKILMDEFGIQKKDKLMRLLQDNKISLDAPSEVKGFFTRIQEAIATIPIVVITLAFEPNEETFRLLSEWFIKHTKKQVLFDITVNQSLIAGIAISYHGKHREFSLKPLCDKTITESITHPPVVPSQPLPITYQNINNMHLGR